MAHAGAPHWRPRQKDEPVKKELEAFQKDIATKAPAERLKAYEEGIDQVKKSGVLEKALKVGDKAPELRAAGRLGEERSSSPPCSRTVRWSSPGIEGPGARTATSPSGASRRSSRRSRRKGRAWSPSPRRRRTIRLTTVEKDGLGFEVLSDKGNKAAHAFGVAYKVPAVIVEQIKGRLDLSKYNGDSSNELPLGATYVIDQEGVIRYAFVDSDYRKRAEPSAVVAALKGLKK